MMNLSNKCWTQKTVNIFKIVQNEVSKHTGKWWFVFIYVMFILLRKTVILNKNYLLLLDFSLVIFYIALIIVHSNFKRIFIIQTVHFYDFLKYCFKLVTKIYLLKYFLIHKTTCHIRLNHLNIILVRLGNILNFFNFPRLFFSLILLQFSHTFQYCLVIIFPLDMLPFPHH
jgi:hypothetical protein